MRGRYATPKTCPHCLQVFRPSRKAQVHCSKSCAMRTRIGRGQGPAQMGGQAAAKVHRAKARARYTRLLAATDTKGDVALRFYRLGYVNGSKAGHRRGFADGWSACAGEMKESA